MSLNELTISEASASLRAKEIKATELTEACLSAIEAGNKALNAFLLVTADKAMEAAKELDKRLGAKSQPGVRALEGIPLGVKDLYCTKGVRSTACSHILHNFEPTYELTVTQNLWDAGAVMLGKLNMDEFAMGSSNETSYFGPCVSPWRAEGSTEKFAPGGSSGGSAAAVAAGFCLGATASDTGGSIRQPAAFTGTVGIKPTYGRCSRWGMIAFASSLDQAGPLARSVKDAALLLANDGELRSEGLDQRRPARAGFREGAGLGREGAPDRHPQGIPRRWHVARDRGALAEGHRDLPPGRCEDRGCEPAAHQGGASGILHRGARRSLVEPRPLRRRALRPARQRQGHHRHV